MKVPNIIRNLSLTLNQLQKMDDYAQHNKLGPHVPLDKITDPSVFFIVIVGSHAIDNPSVELPSQIALSAIGIGIKNGARDFLRDKAVKAVTKYMNNKIFGNNLEKNALTVLSGKNLGHPIRGEDVANDFSKFFAEQFEILLKSEQGQKNP